MRLSFLLIGLPLALSLTEVATSSPQRGTQGTGSYGGRSGLFAPVSDRLGGDNGKRTKVSRTRGSANPSAMKDLENLTRKSSVPPASLLPVRGAQAAGGEEPQLITSADLADDAQVELWFRECDANADSWLAFRETEDTLGFDRARFRSFDQDKDGRMIASEFQEHYRHQFAASGGVRPPRIEERLVLAPPRRARQLRLAFDLNADLLLDEGELAALLEGYGRVDEHADETLALSDQDRSGKLSESELESLAEELAAGMGAAVSTQPLAAVSSVDALFGAPAGADVHIPGSLPRIKGPITPFRRLDLDGDGVVSLQDLESLQRPLRSPIRVAPILLALDGNGDSVLDQAELRAAFGDIH